MRQLSLGLLGITLIGPLGLAQEIATARTGAVNVAAAQHTPISLAMRAEGDTTVGQMLATGFVAAFVGIAGGAYVGYQMAECVADEWFCGVAEAAVGALVGSTLMIPAGIHLVSRHSPFWAKLGTSVLVMGAFTAVALGTNGATFLLIPPMQIIATARIEQLAARREGAPWAQPR